MTRSSSETRVTSSKSLSVRSDLKADTAFVSKSCHWRWKFSPTLISATINAGVMLKVAQLDHFWLGSSLREYVAQICSEVTLQFFVENWRLWWSVDWLQHFLPRWYKWLFDAARLPSVSQQRLSSVSLLPTLLCVCVRVFYSYNRALIIIILWSCMSALWCYWTFKSLFYSISSLTPIIWEWPMLYSPFPPWRQLRTLGLVQPPKLSFRPSPHFQTSATMCIFFLMHMLNWFICGPKLQIGQYLARISVYQGNQRP